MLTSSFPIMVWWKQLVSCTFVKKKAQMKKHITVHAAIVNYLFHNFAFKQLFQGPDAVFAQGIVTVLSSIHQESHSSVNCRSFKDKRHKFDRAEATQVHHLVVLVSKELKSCSSGITLIWTLLSLPPQPHPLGPRQRWAVRALRRQLFLLRHWLLLPPSRPLTTVLVSGRHLVAESPCCSAR